MVYLDPGEYVRFGLPDDTADSLVAAASALIDAYCRRASLGVTTFVERLRVSRTTGTLQLSYGPVVAVTGCRTRLRRIRAGAPMTALQADAMVFGVGGTWADVDPSKLTLTQDGEGTLPASLMGVPADEAEVTYTAGYAVIPDAVKLACAQIVRNAGATPGLNVKKQTVDSLEMEYFSGTLLDADVCRVLQPYSAVRIA